MPGRRSDDDRPDYFRDMPEEFERRPGGPDRSPLRRRHREASDAPDGPSDRGPRDGAEDAAPDGDGRSRP
jgi:hypothetical protein